MESALTAASYASVAAIADQLGRKFEPEDMSNHPQRGLLIEAAGTFISTYSGTLPFLLNVQQTSKQYGMSAGQAKGVLNCVVSEYRRQQTIEQRELLSRKVNSRPDSEPETVDADIIDGRYTVIHEDGGWHTYKIKTVDADRYTDFPADTRMILYMNGPDNENSYAAMAWLFPDGRLHIFQRYLGNDNKQTTQLIHGIRFLLSSDKAAQREAGYQYALKSSRCCICGRTLTVPASIHRGMGPECAGRYS